MRKSLIFIIAILASVHIADGQIVGPKIVCQNTFATFDLPNAGNSTSVTWNIPSSVPVTTNMKTRSVTVQFTDTGFITLSATYSKKTYNYTVHVVYCPSTDCAGTKASSPFLFEDFGTLPNGTARTPLPPGYTTYKYLSSGAIDDGQYIVSDSVNNGRPEWVKMTNHTGNLYGGMMLVNASFQPDTFYTRVITGLCQGAQYSFSAWLLNANGKEVLQSDKICSGKYIYPNLAFVVLDARTGTELGRVNTNDVSMKLMTNGSGQIVDDPTWQRYGFGFRTPPGVDSVKLIMYNIAPGGCGNDIAIDDIEFTYCGPTLIAYLHNSDQSNDTICSGNPDTIFASVTPGYFSHPTYQWQVSLDGVNWTNIAGATDSVYIIPSTDTSDTRYYRFLAAEQGQIGYSTCNSPSNMVHLLVLRSPVVHPGDTTICAGGTATLRAQEGYTSYLWSTGATTSSITVSPPTTTKYYVTASLSSGAAGTCTATDSSLVTVFDPSSVNLGADTNLCVGNTLTLSPFHGYTPSGLTYLWSTGDTTPSIQVTTSGSYWVKVFSPACGEIDDTIQVNFHNPPIVNLGNDTAICQGQSLTLNAGNAGSTYLWNTGATTQQIPTDTAGIYWVKVTSPYGCSASDTLQLTVNPSPIVNLGPDTAICQGQNFTLDAGNPGGSYLWNTGDTSEMITINTGGTYWARVTNTYGCTAADTIQIALNPPASCPSGGCSPIYFQSFGEAAQPSDTTLMPPIPDSISRGFQGTPLTYYATNPFCPPQGTYALRYLSGRCDGKWVSDLDHTPGDTNGYMLIVNPQKQHDMLYRDTIKGTCASYTYTFSLWVANLFKSNGTKPNLILSIIDPITNTIIQQYKTGPIDNTLSLDGIHLNWQQVSMRFQIPSATNAFIFEIDNNGPSSAIGNDFAIDDISLEICKPIPQIMLNGQVKDTVQLCANSKAQFTSQLFPDTLRAAMYQWQFSTDKINWANIPGANGKTYTIDSVRPSHSGYYRLLVSEPWNAGDQDCALFSNLIYLQVNPLPTVNLGPDTAICQGESLTLNAGNPGATYLWSTGVTTQTLAVNATGTYWVKVTNGFGCSASDTLQLTVNPLPIVNLGPDTAICQGENLMLDAGNSGATYLWNTGQTSQSIQIDNAGTYWVKVTNGFGCSASDTLQLTVNPLPTVNLGPDTAICQGENLMLNAGNPGATYLWSTGATTQQININTAGTYWVRVTNGFGCSAADTMQLTVNPLPIVNLGPDTAICQGENLMLNAGNSGATYLWSTGATTQTLAVNATGAYWVRVTNGFGCSSSDTLQLTVNPLPFVNLGPDTAICQGESLMLDAGNSGATYLWSTGATTQTLAVNATGAYWVNVTNSYGCSAADTMQLTVNPLPIVNLGPDTAICQGESLMLDAGNSGATYLWSTGATTQTLAVNTTGTYWVSVTNSFGCSSSDTLQLTVNPLPLVNLGPDTAICQGESLMLNAGNSGASYLWSTGATTQTLAVNATGTYWVRATNGFGCSAADTMQLTVNPLPIVNLGPDTAICQGESLMLNAGNPGANYLWNIGATTQTLAVNTTGTYWVRVTNGFGCSAADTMQLTVNPLPIVNLGPDTAICQGENLMLNAGNPGATYLWSTGATTQQININTAGTYWVRVTNGFGCSAADTMQLTVNPLPIVNLGPDTAICQGENLMLNAGNSGATYLWSTGATTQTLAVNATGTYWVRVTNGFGCSSSDTLQLAVNPLPIVNLGPDTAICQGESLMLDAGNSGATYLWSTGATTQQININTAGTYWVKVTNNYGCSASDTMQFTVNPLPTVNLGPDTAICQGESLMLNAGNSGASYLWSIGATTQTLAVNATGAYWVRVTNGFGCSASDTLQLTVNPLPTVNLGPDTAICQGESLMLNAGNSGATYLWNTGATTQQININTAGTYWVKVTNNYGCSASDTMQFTVNPLPTVNLGPDTAICQGESLMLNAGNSGATYLWSTGATTQTLAVNATGAYWVRVTNGFGCSSSDTLQLTVNPLPTVNLGPDTAICQGESLMLNAGNSGASYLWSIGATTQTLAVNATGTYWVKVTNGFGCSASDTLQLTVNPLPIVNLGPDTAICQGESLMLNAGNPGATYLWNTGATTQQININTAGTYWVKVTNGFGCSAADTLQLTVNPLPIVNLGPDTAICQGESLTLNAGNPGANYLWNTGATTQQININTTGTYWVKVTNGYGCSASDTMQLTVNPLPIVNLGADTAICQGESLMLNAGNSGATYLWSTGATTQTISVNATGTYWVSVTNSFGCSSSDTLQLTVNPLPLVNLGPDTAICQGESLMLNAGNSGASYLWSTGATTQTLAVNATGTYWVRATNGFGCSAADTMQLTVNPLPIVNLGPDTAICQGESLMLNAGNPGANYLWNIGATTQQININTAGTYWVKVTNSYGCSAADTMQLTVNPLPTVNLGPDTAICQGESLMLNAGNPGANYLWSTGATTQQISINTAGTYWVRVTNGFGCSASDTLQLTVNPLPTVNLGPDTAICQGESLTLNAGNSGANYLWSTGATTQQININTAGTYWVKVTNGFGCSASDTLQLTVNPLPIVNLGPDTAICQGESLMLNAGNPGANYLWNTGATTQQININTAGTYWVKVTNDYGCSAADTMQLTVNPLPIVNLGPDTAICQGESLTLNAGNSGASYLWSTGATTQTLAVNATGTYWVKVTNGFGCSVSDTLQLTVNPLPIVNLGPDTAICQGESLMLDAGNPGATYLWNTGATTQQISINTAGTYWVKVTNGFGCSASDTMQLTVNPLPIVNLGPDTAICQGENLMLNAGNSGATYLWNTGATTQQININTAGTYWVKVTNGFGCSSSDTLQLTVNPLPLVNLGPDTAICQGESLMLDAGNSGATYLWNTGATTQQININTAGTYWVKVTNGFGCSSSDTLQLTVNPLPIVNLGPDTAICQGENLLLNAGNSGATYLWNTGATTQQISINTAGTYWVKVTNGFGCSASDTMQLTVNPLPIVNLGPDTAICQGESLMLNAGNSGASYLWSTGATTQQISINTAGTYWVRVTNGFGCSASDTLQLTVNPLPIVNLGPDTAICQGENLMLNAGNSGATYLWNTGATTQQININTAGTYWVKVTNNYGCSAADTMQLTVNPLPIVNLGPDTAICQGESLMLNAGNSGATYLWSTGATTQQININTAGTYWVRITNGFGCSASDTLQLTVNPLPIVNLGPDTAICQGESLMLNAGNSGASYLWSTGATTQTISVNATGTYWVRVTNGFGCSASDTLQLTVNPLPIVNLGPDTAICQGENLMLNAGNSGASYLWSTGATTQTLAVNATGTYWVRVTNSYGCSAADTMQLTVNPLPIVNLGPDTAICQGESLTLDAGNSGATYLWNTGATTQQITVNTTGTYWVKVTNSYGCSAADTTRLQIHPLPVIQVSGDTAVCQGTWITLWVQETLRSRENNTQPSSLLWSTGVQDDSIRVQVNQDIAYWIRVTNTWGCSQSDTIHLKALPLPNLRLAHDTSACQGQPITLDAGGDGIQYRWSTGDTSRQITLKPSGADDDNVYRVEVINRFGCSAKDSVRLRVHPLPQLSLARQVNMCEGQRITLHASSLTGENYTYQWNDQSRADSLNVSRPGTYWVISSNGFCLRIDTVEVSLLSNTLPRLNPEAVLCPNSSLVLDVSSPDAIAYMWSTGATTPAITIDTPGTYTVLINGAVCNYTRLDTVRVKQGFLPGVRILADDSLICSGDRLLLRAIGDHTEGYRWQDGTYGPSYTATTAGLYRVQAFNVCGIATDSIMLQPAADCVGDIIMPNAFTPNNDGHNDVFRPKVLHQVFDFELRIFNRWGQLLFVTHNWTQGWDGTFHGQPCDAGGYAWWVKYRETPGGPVMFKKGVLTLLR